MIFNILPISKDPSSILPYYRGESQWCYPKFFPCAFANRGNTKGSINTTIRYLFNINKFPPAPYGGTTVSGNERQGNFKLLNLSAAQRLPAGGEMQAWQAGLYNRFFKGFK